MRFMTVAAMAATALCQSAIAAPRAPRDAVGVTVVGGLYSFRNRDALNEGAAEVEAMGIKIVKVWLLAERARMQDAAYRQNHKWSEVSSLAARAADPYFRELFARPFHTFVLESFPRAVPTTEEELKDGPNWRDGLNETERVRTEQDFYDLSIYLLKTYHRTGKTFIVQNWEGDNDLKKSPVNKASIDGMIDWIRARQAGIERARSDAKQRGYTNVDVIHAFETNNVATARAGEANNPVKTVIPQLNVDLYSYSVWDNSMTDVIGGAGTGEFRNNLRYLRAQSPPSTRFGRDNIFVGEYGCAENFQCGTATKQLEVVQAMTEAALEEGARYVLYWQLFDNEPHNGVTGPINNRTTRGFWLKRSDASYAPVYHYLKTIVALPPNESTSAN